MTAEQERALTCGGHRPHAFQQDDPDCTDCGHPRSEHPGDRWTDRQNRPAPTWAHTPENDPMGLYDDQWEPIR